MICNISHKGRLFVILFVALTEQVSHAGFDFLITSGVPAPDGNGLLSLPNAPAISSTGQLSFVSQLTGTTGGTADNQGLYRHGPGGLNQIARKGQTLIGRNINFFLSSSIDSSGTVTGIPALSGPPTLIWYLRGDGGALVSPFTLGSPSPSGNNTLLGVTTTAVNDAGVTAFQAAFNGAAPEVGIYLRQPDGTIQTKVLRNSTAPRGGIISGVGTRLTINESNQVTALLSVDTSISSVALMDGAGVEELIREGDVLSDGVTTITQLSSTSSFVTDPIPLINDAGPRRDSVCFSLTNPMCNCLHPTACPARPHRPVLLTSWELVNLVTWRSRLNLDLGVILLRAFIWPIQR
jgi:hypothetical protein